MPNGSNLPSFVRYSNKIKEVTINQLPEFSDSGDCSIFYIKFTEIITKIEEKKFLFFKKNVEIEEEKESFVPFSFKSYEYAKDFAQYLPNMGIYGERIFSPLVDDDKKLCYETYAIELPDIDLVIFVKFTNNSEHTNVLSCKDVDNKFFTEYYINDLDKKFLDNKQGNFYEFDELVVDGFFTNAKLVYNSKLIDKNDIKINKKYETLSEIKDFTNKNIHKFVLVEEKEK